MIIIHQLSHTAILGRTLMMMKNVILDMQSFFMLSGILFFLFAGVENFLGNEISTENLRGDLGHALKNLFNSLNANRNYDGYKYPIG